MQLVTATPTKGPAPPLPEGARGPYLDIEIAVTYPGVKRLPHGRLVLTVLAAQVVVNVGCSPRWPPFGSVGHPLGTFGPP